MNKYGARKTQRLGLWFDSAKEANAYVVLKAREQAGEIIDLVCQPYFELQPAFTDRDGKRVKAIGYTPDFRYVDRDGVLTVVEIKGGKATQTQASRLKIKLFKYRYPHLRFVLED